MLLKGPQRDQDSIEAAKLQKEHLANINRLAEEGIIQIAGPFGHYGNKRGIFIMDAATIEEAEKHVKSDPAVKAGRLSYEIYPWWTAKGSCLE